MALALYDRVQETTATAGTGSITLGGAVAGFQSFAVVGDGNTCYYTIVNGVAWEVGVGTYSTTGPTLARTTVLSNSNGNTSPITLVDASNVFLTYPAEKSVNLDADGVMAVGQPLGYSDTGLLATFVSTETDYNQVVIQNKSNSPTASANLNISNNVSTGTTGFAELGINSSTFTGTNSFELPGAAYLASASTDLVLGTYGAYNIHFVTNSNDTDAMTIYDNGGISLGELANPGIGNIACNNINLKFQQIVTAAGTTTLTNASPYYTQFTGTTTQTLKLPDATTCLVGTTFILDNDSTDDVTIKNGADTTFELLIPGGIHNFVLEDNSTVAGTWLRYSLVPSTVEWGTNSLQLGSTVISGGTWQGGTIQSGYGGTGLTTFTAANNALYSTGASTLTAGTLPIAAGGTGRTSFTSGYIPYGNGTSGLNSSSSLQFNGTYLVVGGATPLGGATNPITAFSSTAAGYVQTYVYNTSNDISASADFVTYADNSTDAHGWADMGFTSSTYNDPVYTVTGPNEAYIFGSAPSGAGKTGNLVYATDYTGSQNAHQWYVGGFTQAKNAWKMQLTSTGLQLANALGTAYGGTGNTSGQAASVANALSAGTGLSFASGTTFDGSAARTLNLANTAVTAGSYTNASITVDAQGRITAASSGSGGGVTSITGTANQIAASASTGAVTLSLPSTINVNTSGNAATATNLSTGRTNWSTNGTITAVVGQLSWKNYGNNHTIFDASNSTTPTGAACNNTNPDVAWAGSYPTLMGYNGTNTYGVRVDSARYADSLTSATWQRITGNAIDYGSYGSIGVSGTTNSYAGISFSGVSGTLMMNSSASGFYYNNSTWRVYWDGSGNQQNTGNVVAGVSDGRLKFNVKEIEQPLEKIRLIRGITHTWDQETCRALGYEPPETDVGVIAQEVQLVQPEVVTWAPFDRDPLVGGSKSGKDYLTVKYEKLVPLLIQTCKALDTKVLELEARLAALEK